MYGDGGTASGTFTFDPVTGLYTNVNITTTPGTVRTTGATYRFVCGQDVPTCTGVTPSAFGYLNLTSTAADQTGMPAMALFFTPALGTTGGPYSAFSLEANCSNAACAAPAGPTRSFAAGVVAIVVGPLSDTYQPRSLANL